MKSSFDCTTRRVPQTVPNPITLKLVKKCVPKALQIVHVPKTRIGRLSMSRGAYNPGHLRQTQIPGPRKVYGLRR